VGASGKGRPRLGDRGQATVPPGLRDTACQDLRKRPTLLVPSATVTPKTEADFYDLALHRTEHEYAQLQDTLHGLEGKAQGAAAVGGLFLAAAFAFVRNSALRLPPQEAVVLGLLVLCLMGGIALSLWVAFVQRQPTPAPAATALAMARDAVRRLREGAGAGGEGPPPGAGGDALYARLLDDQLAPWVDVNATLARQAERKAAILTGSHICLFAAAVLLMLLVMLALAARV
jgi:hypothetical protein